jgi:hypothetical protein
MRGWDQGRWETVLTFLSEREWTGADSGKDERGVCKDGQTEINTNSQARRVDIFQGGGSRRRRGVAGDVRTMSFTAPRAYRKGKGGRRWRRKSTKSPPPSSASYSFPFSLLCAQIALYPYTISLSYSGYQRMEGGGGPENGPARFRRFSLRER